MRRRESKLGTGALDNSQKLPILRSLCDITLAANAEADIATEAEAKATASVVAASASAGMAVSEATGVIKDASSSSITNTSTNNTDILTIKPLNTEKKKINIPVGDCAEDPDYDKIVIANYVLPNNYVRATKKVGDEKDVSADYFIEDEDIRWLESHPAIVNNNEIKNKLTTENSEIIIDIFEKNTGFQQHPISLSMVEHLVLEALKWTSTPVTHTALEIIHEYWRKKRDTRHKPLCRRYWPSASAADSNPRLVFRPRDKERYRLRKQNRKNDAESFKKIQALRKEFKRALSLLNLVTERELLKEAELEVQKEIFDQAIYDITNTTDKPRKSQIYKHTLLYPHLLHSDTTAGTEGASQFSHSMSSSYSVSGNALLTSSNDGRLKISNKTNRTDKDKIKDTTISSSINSSSTSTTSINIINGSEVSTDKLKKRASQSSSKKRKSISSGGGPLGLTSNGSTCEMYDDSENYEQSLLEPMLFPGVPGPAHICRPSWPSFMVPLFVREKVSIQRSLSQYIDDLELRADETPKQYRVRGRIGRGGRLVMDRIPVYDTPQEYWSSDCTHPSLSSSHSHTIANDITYIYPSTLNLTKTNNITNTASHSKIHNSKGPTAATPIMPPIRQNYNSCREKEIYACSDSEDEKVECTNSTNCSDDHVKYTIRL